MNPADLTVKQAFYEIFERKEAIKCLQADIEKLQEHLDELHALGDCPDDVETDHFKVNRVSREGRWIYSDAVKRLKQEEEEDGVATRSEPTSYWKLTGKS